MVSCFHSIQFLGDPSNTLISYTGSFAFIPVLVGFGIRVLVSGAGLLRLCFIYMIILPSVGYPIRVYLYYVTILAFTRELENISARMSFISTIPNAFSLLILCAVRMSQSGVRIVGIAIYNFDWKLSLLMLGEEGGV